MDKWKAYGIVLTVAAAIGILLAWIAQDDLKAQIRARDGDRAEIVRAFEEIRASLHELELRIQGKAIDFGTLDPSDQKAVDRAEELLTAEPDPDARFDEIRAAVDELDKILSRYEE